MTNKVRFVLTFAALTSSAPPGPGIARDLIAAGYNLGLSVAAGLGLTSACYAPVDGATAAAARRLLPAGTALVAVTAVLRFAVTESRSQHVGVASAFDAHRIADFLRTPAGRGDVIGAGDVALLQLGVYLVLLVAMPALARLRSRAAGWVVFALAVLTAAEPNLPYGSVTVNGVARDVLTIAHISGALLWLGGLVVLAAAGLLAGSAASAEARQVWSRFSTVALYAVGLLVVSGSWLAWVHVGTPAQLFTTPYGRYLTIKLALVVVMVAAGAYNVRVLLPALSRPDTVRRLPRVVAVEALVGVGVLLIVPFLAGSARAEAGWPTARSFDVTVFGTGLLLAALVAAALWAGTRAIRPAEPVPEG